MKQSVIASGTVGWTPLPHPNNRSEQVNTVKTAVCIAIAALLLGTLLAISAPKASGAADVVAYKTQQLFTLDGIPSEAFWNQIPAFSVSLSGTTPSGGNVPQMWVKAAHDGKSIYLLLQWPDSKESRKSDRVVRLALSTPGKLEGKYNYNASHYYTDAAAVTWWMGAEKPTVPAATNNEFGSSPTRRASLFGWTAKDKAELWVWKANLLDLGNTHWPYSGIDPGVSKWVWGPNAGKPYTMPYSSAFQNLFNSTGTWTLGDGLLHAQGCQQPGTKPFEVSARGVWSSGMWTMEIARPFASSPENRRYTMPFEEGKTYWTVFAVFDGNKGEWEEVASMSGWVSLEISKESVLAEKQAQEVLTSASQAAKAAGDASKAADAAAKTAGDASKVAGEALKAAQEAKKSGQDATSAAQEALKATQAAQNTLSSAQKAYLDIKNTAETTATISYAAVGLSVVAMALAIAMGLRGRKP